MSRSMNININLNINLNLNADMDMTISLNGNERPEFCDFILENSYVYLVIQRICS